MIRDALMAIKEYVRWLARKDWELVDVEITDERSAFPPIWSPYFVEIWKCNRTGMVRIVENR